MGKTGRDTIQESGQDEARGNQELKERGDFGYLIAEKMRRGRGSYRRRGGDGGRRGQSRRGGRGTIGNRDDRATGSARRTRKSIGKKVQFAERAYCENTNPDIRRII